ncbi:MAG: LCP family protein [Lachnospiraceae bacterium]|nr:LCP family protein [Lachnospiraceae bacterium]
MKMSVDERAHEEHLARLSQYKKKRKQQIITLAVECLLLCLAVLAYVGVRYMAGTFQDIRIDPNETLPSYAYDPDETEPETLPPLTDGEEDSASPTEEIPSEGLSGTEELPTPKAPGEDGTTEVFQPAEPTAFTNPAPNRTADPGSYETYVLFGVDTRKQKELLKYTMGDVCILASVNKDSGDVRLVSVYRDFCVEGENSYFYKLTAAYSKFGAAEAVAILNRNLDLEISDYVVVGWTALADIVDIMGGLEINMSRAEAEQVNNYIEEVRQATGRPKGTKGVEVREGTQTLNGVSVVSYSRIRYFVGNDIERTRRQRYVIGQLLEKIRRMDVSQMLEIVNSLRKNMKTTLAVNEIMSLAYNYKKYHISLTTSFPENHVTSEELGWVFFSRDLTADVRELHRMLYDDDNFIPSANIARIGQYHRGRIKGSVEYQD